MDISEYLRNTRDDVRRAASEQISFSELSGGASRNPASFQLWAGEESEPFAELDRSRAILKAPQPDDIAAAIATIHSPDHGGALLKPALATLALGIAQRSEVGGHVVSLITAPDLTPDDRLAVIDTAQQMTFSPVAFAQYRADYLMALRGLINDRDRRVRRRALSILSRQKDEYAQRALTSGLQGEIKPLLPAAEAIELLGSDTHAELYPLLRQLAVDAPTRTARVAAIHALAGDPSAAPVLAEIVSDADEDVNVRKASARVLHAVAPQEGARLARGIVLSDDEDDGLRATSLASLTHLRDVGALRADSALTRKADQLRKSTRSRALRRATGAYLDGLAL